MTGIYISSKVCHADRWKKWRDAGVPIISTWIDEPENIAEIDFNDLWGRCIKEAGNAKALVIYAEYKEVLKGAWVELGVALGNNVPVFAVGIQNYTIADYKLITHCASLEEAFSLAMAIGV